MIFTLFTVIVFLAELIITFAIIISLLKIDLSLVRLNDVIVEAKPKVKDISELAHKISEQLLELAPDYLKKLEEMRNRIVLLKVKSLMVSILFFYINVKVLNRFKRKKILKFALKGLSLLENMV